MTFITGPAGKLEVMVTQSSHLEKPVTAIICHPHPLYGGTMQNKVVTTLAKAFDELGVKTIRFNFRGVGESEGVYDNAIGETDDLKAVLAWSKTVSPNDEIWLAGFSFGSYVAAKTADENIDSRIKRLITIAPPVNHYDYRAFNHIVCPWLLIIGTEDELIPLLEVQDFISDPPVPLRAVMLQKAGHFFHGRLIELREIIVREISAAD